jgi:hypothetical protein
VAAACWAAFPWRAVQAMRDDLERLNVAGQMTVFLAMFYLFGAKIGAMKHRTGIQ